jgi:hypothetical protein
MQFHAPNHVVKKDKSAGSDGIFLSFYLQKDTNHLWLAKIKKTILTFKNPF